MELVIRFARVDDVGGLHRMLSELENELLDEGRFQDVYLRNLDNPHIAYFIAEANGQPVGMASCHVQFLLHHAAPVAEIQEMYVDPKRRLQGIGRRLVEAVNEFARQKGADQLEVTSNQVRTDTHRFYVREGFRATHFKMVRKGRQID